MQDKKNYIPKQPFFELTTQNFMTRIVSSSGLLAQYYSFVVSPEEDQAIVAVPDGTVDIIFQCAKTSPSAFVYGSVVKGKKILFKKDSLYFGVRFLPSRAEQFLDCPLDQFTDQKIVINDIEKNANELVELICCADSFEKRISLFEKYQGQKNRNENPVPLLVREVLARINRSNGEIRIQTLADETGYSSRYVNKLFKTHVGISPKFYGRIVRFQNCVSLLRSSSSSDFTGLAYDAGYYDQAHFINEFKEFSLSTPSRLFCY